MTSTFELIRQKQQSQVRQFETMAKASQSSAISSLIGGGSGAAVGTGSFSRSKKAAYAENRNWIYVCARAIANRLAAQPFMAGEVVGAPANEDRSSGFWRKAHKHLDERQQWQRRLMPHGIQGKAIIDQEVELIATHPVLDSLHRPNPLQKKFEFLVMSVFNILLTGESYWVGGVTKTEEGERVELWALPTKWITPIHDGELFTGYNLQTSSMSTPEPLAPETVARTYLADPADPKSSMSILQSISAAARTDDAIQTSQQQMMERGIHPNLIITLGKVRGRDGTSERRPRITGAQRRQIVKSIREMWGRTVNAGDPAIIDDMIDSVHKLTNTPQEMDWLSSGRVTKERIFQAFGVNEFVVGQSQNANRAQAVEAEKSFCSSAVNPLVSAFSETATDFLGPMFESPQRLLVWLEKCEPKDPELELKRWDIGRRNDDVTGNEFRTQVLGLPPVEELIKRNVLLSSVGGMTGTVQIMTAMGNGFISPDAVKNLLMLFLEIEDDIAQAIVGEGPELGPTPALPAPPPKPEPIDDAEEVIDDDTPSSQVRQAISVVSASVQGQLDAMSDTTEMMQEMLLEK